MNRYLLTLTDESIRTIVADALDVPSGDTPFQHIKFYINDKLIYLIAVGAVVSIELTE